MSTKGVIGKMVKDRKVLERGPFVYVVVSLWLVTGLLIGALVFMPDSLSFETTMARVAYGLVCLVTVWCGFLAWHRIREYIDVMYDEYLKREKDKATRAELEGKDRA